MARALARDCDEGERPGGQHDPRRANGDRRDQEVGRRQRQHLGRVHDPDHLHRCPEPARETRVVSAADREDLHVDPFGEAVAHDVRPARDRDRRVVREGERPRQARRGRVVAPLTPRLPGSFTRIHGAEHLGAEPPQRRDLGVIREEATTRDDDAHRVVREPGEAVRRFLEQRGVVLVGGAGEGSEPLERSH